MDSTTADKLELQELRAAYGHHIDRGEWDEWVTLFTPDAIVDYGPYDTLHGHDDIRSFASDVIDGLFTYSMHLALMPLLEVDGDKATGRWHLLVLYEASGGDPGWLVGTYEDTYRRVDGEWKFTSVTNVVDIDTGAFGEY
ncbi:nuclear transport factor 2 family protein [Natrialbaceae archaeon A-CW1-1]